MNEGGSRPLTRKRAQNDKTKADYAKRVKMLQKSITMPSSNCIVVDESKIKREPLQIKTEPEYLTSRLDQPQVIVKEEMDPPPINEELIILDKIVESSEHHTKCLEEIKVLKEAFDTRNRYMDSQVQELKDAFALEHRSRDLEVAKINDAFEEHKRCLALKIDAMNKKLEEKDAKIKEINERLDKVDKNVASNDVPAVIESIPNPQDECFDERVLNLFPQVLEVMWLKYLKARKNGREYMNFNCRLACKDWNSRMFSLMKWDAGLLKKRIDNKARFCKNPLPSIQAWLYGDIKGPFPPTALYIRDLGSYRNYEYFKEYTLSLSSFLRRYGRDIKYLHYTMDYANEANRHFSSLQDWYSTFLSWLDLMPNINMLKLRDNNNAYVSTEMFSNSILKELVRRHPLPQLTCLTDFHISGCGYSECMFVSILATNPSIRKVTWNYQPSAPINANVPFIPNGPFNPSTELPHVAGSPFMEHPLSTNLAYLEIDVNSYSNFLFLRGLTNVAVYQLRLMVASNLDLGNVLQVAQSLRSLHNLEIISNIRHNLPPINIPGLEKLRFTVSGSPPRGMHSDQWITQLVSNLLSLRQLHVEGVHLGDLSWYPEICRSIRISKLRLLQTM